MLRNKKTISLNFFLIKSISSIYPINKDCIASYFEIKIKNGRLINFYIYLIKNSDKISVGLVDKSFPINEIIG